VLFLPIKKIITKNKFSYIMATSFSGGGSRSTRREEPIMTLNLHFYAYGVTRKQTRKNKISIINYSHGSMEREKLK
jgi:hypothetical protein